MQPTYRENKQVVYDVDMQPTYRENKYSGTNLVKNKMESRNTWCNFTRHSI